MLNQLAEDCAKGGFYHDGRFATLADVLHHYNAAFGLGLAGSDIVDLVEYEEPLIRAAFRIGGLNRGPVIRLG